MSGGIKRARTSVASPWLSAYLKLSGGLLFMAAVVVVSDDCWLLVLRGWAMA